jgi:hypothetical protein
VSNVLDSPNTHSISLTDTRNMGSTAVSTPTALPVTEARFVHEPSHAPDLQEVPRQATAGSSVVPENSNHFGSQAFQLSTHEYRNGQGGQSITLASAGPAPARGPVPPLKKRRTEYVTDERKY